MLARVTIGIVLLALLGYGFIEARPLILGPRIMLDSPAQDASFDTHIVTISGTALRTQSLTLDGTPLLIDTSGKFYTILTIPSGGSILSLQATDRFGRTTTLTRTVLIRT